MKVTYSGKMDIGGGGIGTTAWHQVKALMEHSILDSVYALNGKQIIDSYMHKVPNVNAPRYDIGDIYFDGWCALHMKEPEILQSWMMHSLFQMNAFPNATKIVNLFSAHPLVQNELMKGEPGYDINDINYTSLKKGTRELEVCDYINIPSEFIYKSLKKYDLHDKAKIIPFGVDLEKFYPVKHDDEKFKIIFVGENWSRKGLHYLLAAWYKLKLNNAELVVAGIKSEWSKLLNPNNDPSVRIGWVDDLTKELQTSTAFCLPAVEDGCPLACYEAMACGIPVIISKNTGTYQHVEHGRSGFVIEPKNISAIQEYIQVLYDDRELARKMGKRARKVIEDYTWDRHELEYAKWIKSL